VTLVVGYASFVLDLFIQCFIAWKPKGMSNHAGAKNNITSEEVREDVTINLPKLDLLPSSSSKLSIKISSIGDLEKLEQAKPTLEEQEYHPPVKTWISRWLAFPIVSLFSKDRREEWLGDLYESHQEMINEEYPHWSINVEDVLLVLVLIGSALKINFADLIKLGRK
jgi:hypothetical protein